MKVTLQLTDREARLILTFVRRSCFEQYYRNMNECVLTEQENKNISYETIEAFANVRDAISEKLNGGN